VHPTGKFVYVGKFSTSDVAVFSVNSWTGALTAVGTGASAGGSALSMVIDSSEKVLYLANGFSIDGFVIDNVTGALQAMTGRPFFLVSGATMGQGPTSIAVSN
jgi:6-phosphogluconolactonase (cycloisomerase 2 family)